MNNHDVVVYVDDSDAAMSAVRWAAQEASMSGSGLHLVAVYDDRPPLVSWAFPDELGPDTIRYLYTRLDEAQIVARRAMDTERHDEATVETELARGDTTDILVDRSTRAEVIVVPSTGFSPHDPVSPYPTLLARSSCPLVVVGEDSADGLSPLGAQIIVGVDGSPASAAAIARAFVEADRRGALLHAVHVWDVDHHASVFAEGAPAGAGQTAERAVVAESLAGYAQDFPDVPTVMSTVYDDPVECLTRMSMRADLVIVGSRECDIRQLLEDEALLALPQAPKHEQCPDTSLLESLKSEKVSPFAGLKNLKSE